MENIIFYSLLLVCIILLFIVGYNFTKINKYKSNAQFWQESYNDVVKRVKELLTKNSDLNMLLGIRDNSINQHKLLIEGQEKTITEQNNKIESYLIEIKKQHDLILLGKETIDSLTNRIKEQNESLTNHLQERAKEKKPFNVLESLEDLIPRKEVVKTKGKHKDK